MVVCDYPADGTEPGVGPRPPSSSTRVLLLGSHYLKCSMFTACPGFAVVCFSPARLQTWMHSSSESQVPCSPASAEVKQVTGKT